MIQVGENRVLDFMIGPIDHRWIRRTRDRQRRSSDAARHDVAARRVRRRRVAASIEDECDRLTRLITDLLDLSRIQAGRVAMSFGPVDLADLLNETGTD